MTDTIFASTIGGGSSIIVFIHGFGGSHAVWHELQAALAVDCMTIAYDLPGHGRSLGVPEAGPAKTAVRAIVADLRLRGVTRAHFVGHSMGGAIATLIGIFEPNLVASLTLLAPGGFGEAINGQLLRRYAAAVDAEGLRPCLEMMSGWDYVPSDDLVARHAATRALPGQREKLIEIAALITRGERQGVIPLEKRAQLNMPVTVVWGTRDCVLPVEQSQHLPPLFALHLAHGAGHMLIEEQPELVRDLIRRTIR